MDPLASIPEPYLGYYLTARDRLEASDYAGAATALRALLTGVAVDLGNRPHRTFGEHIAELYARGFGPSNGLDFTERLILQAIQAERGETPTINFALDLHFFATIVVMKRFLAGPPGGRPFAES